MARKLLQTASARRDRRRYARERAEGRASQPLPAYEDPLPQGVCDWCGKPLPPQAHLLATACKESCRAALKADYNRRYYQSRRAKRAKKEAKEGAHHGQLEQLI